MKNTLKWYYFTFGHNQPNFPGFHKIKAENEGEAREIMFSRYKDKWSFCYDSYDKIHIDDRREIKYKERKINMTIKMTEVKGGEKLKELRNNIIDRYIEKKLHL